MRTVRRTNGIRRAVRRIVLGKPDQRFVTAGDRACGEMMRSAVRRRRHGTGPCDDAIMAWAMLDLWKESIEGFWDRKPAAAA